MMDQFCSSLTKRPAVIVSTPDNNEILQFICSRGGEVKISELCEHNFFANQIAAKFYLERHHQYFNLEQQRGNYAVRALTPAEICDEYDPKKDDCSLSGCDKFHLCKHHITGSCTFGTRYKSNHNIHSTHNEKALETNQLEDLDDGVILQLLKLSCVECTVPDVCTFYNSAKGCRSAEKCTFLHVCLHFINGNCKFSNGCRRSHNILESQPKTVLQKFGIDVGQSPANLVRVVRYKKRLDKGGDDIVEDATANGSSPSKTSIAGDQSRSAPPPMKRQTSTSSQHLTSPALQQSATHKADDTWDNSEQNNNLQIEKTFSDPNRNYAKLQNRIITGCSDTEKVDLKTMTLSLKLKETTREYDVRRIAPSFENQGWKKSFSTMWLWYWKDDDNKYVEYGKQSGKGTEAAIESSTLEEAFVKFQRDNHEGTVQFGTGRFTYEISFHTMKQKNVSTGKSRRVKRRPIFATKTDVNERVKRYKDLPPNTSVPDTWDPASILQAGEDFKLCLVIGTSHEYRDVETRFLATVPLVKIVSIKRVQNMELWDDFTRKQKKMEKRNGSAKMKPELLFHGTTENVISAICQQGFDHRLSGTRVGAKHGQGSYFHKSANYSDAYAKRDSFGQKHMFLTRVLVGSYTRGSTKDRRPPLKDPRKPLEDFHDTCVDSVSNPSIFVVFDDHQVYPEYLITYR